MSSKTFGRLERTFGRCATWLGIGGTYIVANTFNTQQGNTVVLAEQTELIRKSIYVALYNECKKKYVHQQTYNKEDGRQLLLPALLTILKNYEGPFENNQPVIGAENPEIFNIGNTQIETVKNPTEFNVAKIFYENTDSQDSN